MSVTNEESPVARPDSSRRIFIAALLAVLTLACAMRLYGLGDEAYWLDELHSLVNSAGRRAEFEAMPHGKILESVPRFTDLTANSTWPTVYERMQDDSHPPAYFLLLLTWRRIVGDSESMVRLLPTIFSVLSLIPFAMMLRRIGGTSVALVAVAVLCVSYGHVHAAQENRPYSLGILFVSISYWSLVELTYRESRERLWWGVVYGLSIYLAVMTHYFTVLAMTPHVLWVVSRRGRCVFSLWAFIVVVAAIVFGVTWGGHFVAQLDFISNQPWLTEDRPDHNLRTLLRVTNLPIRLLFTHELYSRDLVLSVAGVALLGAAAWSVRRYRPKGAMLFAAWYLFPVLFFAIVDAVTQRQVLTQVRYVSFAVPGLVGFLVLAVAPLRTDVKRVVVVAFLLLFSMTIKLPTQENPKNRRAAELISQQIKPGDLLVFDAMGWPSFWTARIYHNVSYYLHQYLDGPFPPVVLLRDPPTPALRAEIARYNRLVVVAPRMEIPNPIPERYDMITKTGYVRMVGFIYLFERRPAE